jgi:hypothetical protein
MQIAKRLTASVIAATLIAGCASSGGGGGGKATATYADGSTRELTLQEFLACLLTAGLLCPRSPNQSTTTAYSSASSESTSYDASAARTQESVIPTPSPVPFTRWQDHRGDPGAIVTGQGATTLVSQYDVVQSSFTQGGTVTLLYEASGGLREFRTYERSLYPRADFQPLADQLAIDLAFAPTSDVPTTFTSVRTDAVAMVANPHALDWNYQSFGVWSKPDVSSREFIYALSYGAASPGASVPVQGAATFTGRLAGMLAQPKGQNFMAAADVSVHVEFGPRSLGFSSRGTTILRDSSSAIAAPHLDLSGVMTYAPGSNAFSGTLATSNGQMSGSTSGRFYGPAAEELGGAFLVKSQDGAAFTGAYGAKR